MGKEKALDIILLDGRRKSVYINDETTGENLMEFVKRQFLDIADWKYFDIEFLNPIMQFDWLKKSKAIDEQLYSACVQLSVKHFPATLNEIQGQQTKLFIVYQIVEYLQNKKFYELFEEHLDIYALIYCLFAGTRKKFQIFSKQVFPEIGDNADFDLKKAILEHVQIEKKQKQRGIG